MQTPILLLGADGIIGQGLYHRLGAANCCATGFGQSTPHGKRLIPFDARVDSLEPLLGQYGPFRHAVVLIAQSSMMRCAHHPKECFEINVTAVKRVIDSLWQHHITPVFLSSDAVFSGVEGTYSETDPTDPCTTYGRHKQSIEQYLLSCQDRPSLIIRLAKVYGDDPDDGSLFSAWLQAGATGNGIMLAIDQRFCPLFIDDAVQGILRLIETQTTGVVHLAGPRSWNRADLIARLQQLYHDHWQQPLSLNITRCLINEVGFPEPLPVDMSLTIDRLIACTGFRPVDVEEPIKRLVTKIKPSA